MKSTALGMITLCLAATWPVAAPAATIGFAQVGHESEWRINFTKSMVDEAQKRGTTLRIVDADGSRAVQVEAIRRFIAEEVDAIVLAPVVIDGWDEVLEEARLAGIPVFIVDRAVDADPKLYVTRIAANFNLEGKLAGAWLAQASLGRCAILELQGTPGSAAAVERKRGFESIIEQFPGMRIVGTGTGHFTRAQGQATMTDLLVAARDPDAICAVFAHNDDMMLGAIEAMKAAGLDPGRKPLTISIDSVSAAFAALRAGELNVTIELKSDIGGHILEVVEGYLAGRRDYPKWILVPSDLHEGAPRP
ncbi:ABC transporter substrate-binding protein [Chthonobacter albigriseus]|uniref:ABC transporter substrate-binding protein n=1 Tax=Chthonobacter albigriseus TaxID=1683161 RepID=UPI0015EF4AAC|nr:ABC transporter substrate-binding protein [Chthonobacter albigriseus]